MSAKTPLFDALKKYAATSRGYFRIPGHRFERGINSELIDYAGKNIFKLDVTETPLTDDLHHPGNVIAESQRITAEAFGADESFYLVNGTTCGNESMVMASASEGEKIIVPRNAHKSVMAGLILSGARPIYFPVDYLEYPGLQAGLSAAKVEEVLKTEPDCKAVFAVSPTYHGLCSDISSIAETAHKKGIPLLVDEAHGAHCYFSELLPNTALAQNADACAQSLHKVAGALTQSSLLHLKSTLIDRGRLDSALRLTMSTSPSYILMTSLEMAVADLIENGGKFWEGAVEMAEALRERIGKIPGLTCLHEELIGRASVVDKDPTRIIVNFDGIDVTGYLIKKMLYDEFQIDAEMADSRNVLFIITFGNSAEECGRLVSALSALSARFPKKDPGKHLKSGIPPIPSMELTPRQAYFSASKPVAWEKAVGLISAEMIAPYPPGIPILYPGERITRDIYEFVRSMKSEGRHFHGPADHSLEYLRVCN